MAQKPSATWQLEAQPFALEQAISALGVQNQVLISCRLEPRMQSLRTMTVNLISSGLQLAPRLG